RVFLGVPWPLLQPTLVLLVLLPVRLFRFPIAHPMLFPSFSPSRLTYLIAASLLIALGLAPAQAQTQDQSDFRRTPEGVVYKVVRDETLIAIARRFTGRSTDWRELARVNRISNDRAIPIGTEILIP